MERGKERDQQIRENKDVFFLSANILEMNHKRTCHANRPFSGKSWNLRGAEKERREEREGEAWICREESCLGKKVECEEFLLGNILVGS